MTRETETAAADYYALLEVPRSATRRQIRSAYRRLARQCHPDLNPHDSNAETRFKRVAEAYRVLAHRARRSDYDRRPGAPRSYRAPDSPASVRPAAPCAASSTGHSEPDYGTAYEPVRFEWQDALTGCLLARSLYPQGFQDTSFMMPIVFLLLTVLLVQSQRRPWMLLGIAGAAYWLWQSSIAAPRDFSAFPAVAGATIGGGVGAMAGRLLRGATGYVLAAWIGAGALGIVSGVAVAGFLWYWESVIPWIGASPSWTPSHAAVTRQVFSVVVNAPCAAVLAAFAGTMRHTSPRRVCLNASS